MASKTEASPIQPSSPIRPPTPHPSYTHPQNPYEGRPLPFPPRVHNAILRDLNSWSTRPNHHRRRRWILSIFIFIFLILTAILISFLVIKQNPPIFTVERININGFKRGIDPVVLSTNIHIKIKIFNPYKYLGVIFEADNYVVIRYVGVRLGSGGFPVFYLEEKNSTSIDLPLAGVGLQLSSADREAILKEPKKQNIPFTMEIRTIIRFKAGNMITRASALKAFCNLRVNDLVRQPVLMSNNCKSSLSLWFI